MAKTIITLGREYCTGGRYIAEDVANALGIKLYDKDGSKALRSFGRSCCRQ